MSEPILRYVPSSQIGSGPLFAVQSDLPSMVVTKTASMPLEHGVRGQELLSELRKGMMKFVRAMELQGLTVIPIATGNPLCMTYQDGRPYGTFSLHHSLEEAMPDRAIDDRTEGQGPATQIEPRSLEASKGLVDYHFVGVFWAPRVSIEIAVNRDKLLAKERSAKNPTTWGGGSATPNRPSISR